MKRKIIIIALLLGSFLNVFSQAPLIQWQKCYGGGGNDEAFSIIHTFDGGYAVTGGTSSNDGDVSGNHGGRDCWVIKLNNVGVIQWQKCLGGTSDDYGYAILQMADGG